MVTGSELEKVVYAYWANRFGCAPESFRRAGTVIARDKVLGEAGLVYVYGIDQRSVVRIGAELASGIGLVRWDGDASTALSVEELRAMIEPFYAVVRGRTLLICYLDGEQFQPFRGSGDLGARRVHPQWDNELLIDLYDACTEADLDEAEIYVDEPDSVIFGLFDEGLLAAYAGHRYWGETIADIGVLIRPEYRSRGLGKAVVTLLCEWCLDNDVLPMYRVPADHLHSRGIARALGFQEMVVVKTLELETMANAG